jgi:hypothetical protein
MIERINIPPNRSARELMPPRLKWSDDSKYIIEFPNFDDIIQNLNSLSVPA